MLVALSKNQHNTTAKYLVISIAVTKNLQYGNCRQAASGVRQRHRVTNMKFA
jgi:hypothetical protein